MVAHALTFSHDNILAIATDHNIELYDVKTHSFISTLPVNARSLRALAFSPDDTHLAVGGSGGSVYLWDIEGIDACSPHSGEEATAVTALALSRDCSRLACGFRDGTVELWETSPTKRRIASHQAYEGGSVCALGFGPDGGLFASGSDGYPSTIKLWSGKDGSLRGTLNDMGRPRALAVSNSVLVAAGCSVMIWGLGTLSLIHTFQELAGDIVSIAENSALIAVADSDSVTLLDAENHRTITKFDVRGIHTMTFLPDNLQLVAQSQDGGFVSFNLISKHLMKGGATLEHIIQLPNISLWHGIPIWHCLDNEQQSFTASFPQHKTPVPVVWIPRHIHVTTRTHGSSMIALGCWDGHVILLRLPSSHVG